MASTKRKQRHTCDECFFRCNHLCALDLDEPCATFRPDTPQGLVPPRQPALLLRDSGRSRPLGQGLAGA